MTRRCDTTGKQSAPRRCGNVAGPCSFLFHPVSLPASPPGLAQCWEAAWEGASLTVEGRNTREAEKPAREAVLGRFQQERKEAVFP